MKSWKTTAFGAATIFVALLGAAKAVLDGDPATNPDWNFVFTQVTLGIGLIFAKDANVTGGTVAATTEATKRLGG